VALWEIGISGRPAARCACELLLQQLAGGSSNAPFRNYDDILMVLFLLSDPCCQGDKGLGIIARRALYEAGKLQSTHVPAFFFEPHNGRHTELLPGSCPTVDGRPLFAEPSFADTALVGSLNNVRTTSKWFELGPTATMEMGLEDGSCDLPPRHASFPELVPSVTDCTPQWPCATEPRLLSRRRHRPQVAWQTRLVGDAFSESGKGSLSQLDILWISSFSRIQERALWEHPIGIGLFDGRAEHARRAGEEWVRAAHLALHGIGSCFFTVGDPGCDVRVTFRRNCAHDMGGKLVGAAGPLGDDWAVFATHVLRLRWLSQELLQDGVGSPGGLAAQAVGGVLRGVLAGLDQGLQGVAPVALASQKQLGTDSWIGSEEGLTPLSLWTRARPWAWQAEELACLCGCEGAVPQVLPKGVALLEYLFERCRVRQISTCALHVHPHSVSGRSPLAELAAHYLLEKALEPYLRCVGDWIYHGELKDPYGEFVETSRSSRSPLIAIRTPSFLYSIHADIERSGRLLGTLPDSKHSLSNDLFPSSTRVAVPGAIGLSKFFNYSLSGPGGLGFLPPGMATAREKSPLNAPPERSQSYLSLRFSVQACEAHGTNDAEGIVSMDRVSLPSSPSSNHVRSTMQSPSEESGTPATRRRSSLSDGSITQAELRRRRDEAEKRERQRALRDSLDVQTEDNRIRREAAAAAAQNEPSEIPVLDLQATPAAVAAARERLLAEHNREVLMATAQAAYLKWRLQRLRLTERRRRFLLSEMEALHEELLESSGRPRPQLEFDTWGSVVNPFEGFERFRHHMLGLGESPTGAEGSVDNGVVDSQHEAGDEGVHMLPDLVQGPTSVSGNSEAVDEQQSRLGTVSRQRNPDVTVGCNATVDIAVSPDAVTQAVVRAAYVCAAARLHKLPQSSRDGEDQDQEQQLAQRRSRRSKTGPELLDWFPDSEHDTKGGFASNAVVGRPKPLFSPTEGRIGAVRPVDCAQDVLWAEITGAVPLDVCTEQCLLRVVRLQARVVDATVARRFVEDLKLMRCLSLVHRYVLMGESRLVESFVIEAFDRYALRPREGSLAPSPDGLKGALNLLFQATIPRPADLEDDTFLGALRLDIATSSLSLGAGPWKFLQALHLEIGVGLPVGLVFPSNVRWQYTRLFRLLALMLYGLYNIKQSWFRLARGIPARADPLQGPLVPAWVMALRHRMHYFITVLQRYLLVDIVAAEFAKLEARIAGTASLDAILSAHVQFLDVCASKCFLGPGAEGVLGTIVCMVEQAIHLRHAASLLPLPEAARQLRAIESTFLDLRRKLKLSLPDSSVSQFVGQDEDFLEEWLVAWAWGCSE